jgi:putative phosphoesterase
MRILLISDLHANPWALRAVEEDAGPVDHILCAGDTVNYGPRPGAAWERLCELGALSVRGNHDHAVGWGADPRASPAKQPLALAMRDWTRQQLSEATLAQLRSLELSLVRDYGGCRFMVLHGTPVDPLYDYRLTPKISEPLLAQLLQGVKADVLVVGHTHLPLLRSQHGCTILNPGSVGQPLDGDYRASYALWRDGEVLLRRTEYDRVAATQALAQLPLNFALSAALQRTLWRGSIAS